MHDTTITELLHRIGNGRMEQLSDEELEVWWQFISDPELDRHPGTPRGYWAGLAYSGTCQERRLRSDPTFIGNVLAGMVPSAVRGYLEAIELGSDDRR